jgi:hypothetical protein
MRETGDGDVSDEGGDYNSYEESGKNKTIAAESHATQALQDAWSVVVIG